MLNDATCFQAVYIVCGYTDLRFGMDRLAAVIEAKTGSSPYVPGTLYLFCGRRSDRIKGLVWEGDGWLLLYKRLSESQFQWPRNAEEVRRLTKQQFRWLMEGLTITPKRSVPDGGTSGIYRMTLCKTEKFPGCCCHSGRRYIPGSRGRHRHGPRPYIPCVSSIFF